MKNHHTFSPLEACVESAEGLFDILCIGATALEDCTPEADARNLRDDLAQISGDFRRVMSGIASGNFDE